MFPLFFSSCPQVTPVLTGWIPIVRIHSFASTVVFFSNRINIKITSLKYVIKIILIMNRKLTYFIDLHFKQANVFNNQRIRVDCFRTLPKSDRCFMSWRVAPSSGLVRDDSCFIDFFSVSTPIKYLLLNY